MEFCAGGDLAKLISERKELRIQGKKDPFLPQSFILKVFSQMLSALTHLHTNDKVITISIRLFFYRSDTKRIK